MPEPTAPAPRRRLTRLTVRRLMILVAVVAVLVGLPLVVWREFSARVRMRTHHQYAYQSSFFEWFAVKGGTPDEARLARLGRRAAYHREMYDKWVEAARYPWRPVAPDPPPD